MAEAWARRLKPGQIEPYSAGVRPQGLNPRAVQAMAEAGVDISDRRSKHLDEFRGVRFDYVVTLCDDAREDCPIFTGGVKTLHAGFDDPPRLAQGAVGEEEIMKPYRRVRDEIHAFVESLPAGLSRP